MKYCGRMRTSLLNDRQIMPTDFRRWADARCQFAAEAGKGTGQIVGKVIRRNRQAEAAATRSRWYSYAKRRLTSG
ncbi:hypothetical protein [Streptomyces massasporeus]|uniref:hypothetical protein n=1 Tax=Streptomyces massasporeus TaxID=67324 RepID=UPI0036A72C57